VPGAQVACHYFLVVERILKGRDEFEFVVEGVNGDECGEALACFSRGTLDLSEVEAGASVTVYQSQQVTVSLRTIKTRTTK
jgi:hypothetical protein